jgi:transcriptional regulator with PAS, ATPase and Fis domain
MSTEFAEAHTQPIELLASSDGNCKPTTDRKSFQARLRDFEHDIIAEALKETGGKVTRAAKNLGLTHQGLCYLINHRHKDLLAARTPIRVRRKSIMRINKRRRPK